MEKVELLEFDVRHFSKLMREFQRYYGDVEYWESWVDRLVQNKKWNDKILDMTWRDKRKEVISWCGDKLKRSKEVLDLLIKS